MRIVKHLLHGGHRIAVLDHDGDVVGLEVQRGQAAIAGREQARSLDDIERDFLAALCETRETRPA